MKDDGEKWCLALVDSDNLHLLHKHELIYDAYCLTRLDETHVIVGQYYGYLTIFGITSNTIEQKCQIQLQTKNNWIYCIYKVSDTQILVGGDRSGVQMIKISRQGEYAMTKDASFHLLTGESINSMVPLKIERYLCAVKSGSLQMIDIKTKTASDYAHKY